MAPIATGAIVFACTLAGALLGTWLRNRLPSHQLDKDTQTSIIQVNGLISTMAALILGLMTASAQDSFTKVGAAVEHTAVDVVALDRLLARYGPQTAEIRNRLRRAVERRLEAVWPAERPAGIVQVSANPNQEVEQIGAMIVSLEPQTPSQTWLKSRALELTESLLAGRWGIFAARGSAISNVFLVIMTFWLSAAFAVYALLAPSNRTMSAVLVVGALSVACVFFLILELGDPFQGRIAIAADTLRFALAHLGE